MFTRDQALTAITIGQKIPDAQARAILTEVDTAEAYETESFAVYWDRMAGSYMVVDHR